MIDKDKLVLRAEDLSRLIKEINFEQKVFTDSTVDLGKVEVKLDKVSKDMEEMKATPDKIKSWIQIDKPINIEVPKNSTTGFDITIDAITATNNLISFTLHVPPKYISEVHETPYVTSSNKYALDTMESLFTVVDNITDNNYNYVQIDFQKDITLAAMTLVSGDPYIMKYEPSPDKVPPSYAGKTESTVPVEPPSLRQDIPSPDLLVRSHTVKWLEGIKRSDYILLELAKLTQPDTAYLIREDDRTDNLTFKFTSKEDARQKIPEIYKAIPKLWHLVTIEFEDNVTDISDLFSNELYDRETEDTKFTTSWPKLPKIYTTPKAIKGNGITNAENLFRGSVISKVSPILFEGLPRLSNLNNAFRDTDDIVNPISETLIDNNPELRTAVNMFRGSSLASDPGLWKRKPNGGTYVNFTNYMTDTPANRDPEIDIPWPWAATADGNVSFFTWKNVQHFKDTYEGVMNEVSTEPDRTTNFTGKEFEILEGNLDEMFMDTFVEKLPDSIKAVNAKSAIRFAKGTNIVSTLKFPRIFEKCPQLMNITSAFEGCTRLTTVGDFIGASDTISNYDAVFKDCTSIEPDSLAKPWMYSGLEGYPLDVQGVNGYKNIPNLPEDVPVEWGGQGIGTTTSAVRSITPTLEYCYTDDDYITLDIKTGHKVPGGIFEICLVDPDNRHILTYPEKRFKFRTTVAEAGRKYTIGVHNFSDKTRLASTDCARVRYLEPKVAGSKTHKVWSDFVYQTPINKPKYTGDQDLATLFQFTTWEE